jgi:KaiC/GvpD/RAD55 family RecA-like ATPase
MNRGRDPARSTREPPDGGTVSTFDPGSNVLVRGSSLAGKRGLALALLAALPVDECPVVLSAATDPEQLQRRLVDAGSADPGDRWYVIDAVRSRVDGERIACTDGGGDRRTWYVASPGDLTGIGMSTSRALSAVTETGDRPRVLVDSLSTLLQYSSSERVYRFLHVFNGRVAAVGGVSIQVVHADAHAARTVGTLAHLFDVVFDVHAGDDESVTVRTGRSSAVSLPMGELLSNLTAMA